MKRWSIRAPGLQMGKGDKPRVEFVPPDWQERLLTGTA